MAMDFCKSHASEYDNNQTTMGVHVLKYNVGAASMILVSVWAIMGRNMPPVGHVAIVWYVETDNQLFSER
jgi:hypothetical protein